MRNTYVVTFDFPGLFCFDRSMQSSEIRKKFLEFFEARGHTVVPSSSLIPDDPSVLLTTAGMQQFKPYYTGEADPMTTIHPALGKPLGSKNAVSIQKSFRTSDIDQVGDERHLTFFEMMGNFSFGGYFKEKAIALAYEFLTKEMKLTIEYVTVFEGLNSIGVPEDIESQKIWKSLDSDIKIIKQGMEDVFWGPTGSAGPCGPTTEIYCKNGAAQDIEIWNIVFNEFFFSGSREELLAGNSGKKLEPLKTSGVDTGMGLERLAMIAQGKKNIFDTDLFEPFIAPLPSHVSIQTKRIIADHARAIIFLISDGILPSNKDVGYILRRLIRRYIVRVQDFSNDYFTLLGKLIEHYKSVYSELDPEKIFPVFKIELSKFEKTLSIGRHELEKTTILDGPTAFRLYESYGLPYEVIKDLGGAKAGALNREDFDKEFKKHQEISRAGAEAKFGGHGLYLKTGEVTIRDESEVEKVTRLHTATHLMHAGLRAVLGPEVRQDGSDITAERTRFDFRFGRKVTPDELKKVEEWVNDAVEKDLTVKWEEMSYQEALAQGALGFFHEKYPERVKVYTMFDPKTNEMYSKELCGGPHVTHTGEIGRFRITKEESSSAGVRRIRGVVE